MTGTEYNRRYKVQEPALLNIPFTRANIHNFKENLQQIAAPAYGALQKRKLLVLFLAKIVAR